jgi:uncharacterized protein YdeI (BOF family)
LAGSLLPNGGSKKLFSEDFMNKRTHSRVLLISLGLLLGVMLSGAQLNAQQPAMQPDQQSPSQPTAEQPAQQTEQQPGQSPAQTEKSPDSQAQTQQSEAQTFTGTIMKSGDKYVLKDSASGTMYDVDRQDLVKTHEGKRVRIQGTLDSDGKTIHVK